MIRINNRVQLIGTVMYLNTNNFNDEVKSVSLHLATRVSKLDKEGNYITTETSHLCIAFGKHANTLEKLTSKGSWIAVQGVLISTPSPSKKEDNPTAYVQVEELLLLNSK